ncbi:MAG: hypothetical protein U0359_19275 [Byssovorax sp.]
MRALSLRTASLLLPIAFAALSGCSGGEVPQTADEEDLTSVTARSRSLQFDAYVYVSATATDSEILAAVQKQTKTMFGPLRTAEIGVNNRELKITDTSSFKKTKVTVVDTKSANAPTKSMQKVTYRYTDDALVPVSMSKRSAITLAVMSPSYTSQTDRILTECTENDDEAQEFSDSIWYVFDASLSQCQDAIAAEQKAIDAENQKLTDVTKQVSLAEVNRLYVPTTVSLGPNKTNKKKSYPEYDRLYAGGVEPGKVVIGLVNGFLDHEHPNGEIEDSAYPEWLDELRETMKSGPKYKVTKVEPAADLSTFTANGKTVNNVTIYDILAWGLDGKLPSGFTRPIVRAQEGRGRQDHPPLGDAEAPIKVKVGSSGRTKDAMPTSQTYFGAEGDSTPHKRGIDERCLRVQRLLVHRLWPARSEPLLGERFPSRRATRSSSSTGASRTTTTRRTTSKSGGTANLELITNGPRRLRGTSATRSGGF